MADYWLVDLANRRLEVYREPVADATCPFGHRYRTVQVLAADESVAPLAAPEQAVAVADLLP